jgi:hypothetical protein
MSGNKIGNGNLEKRKGAGRPKGSVNKVTAAAKDVISKAAEGLGGSTRLLAWAKEDPANEKAFWTSVYPKLLPLQLSGDPDSPIVTKVVREIVKPSNSNG